jgi:molecular chaperone DnaK
MRAAAQLAGLAPIRLLDESVAVAIAYGVDHLPGDSYTLVHSADSVSYSALLSLTTGTLAIHAITQSSDIDPELALDARILDFVVNRYANLTGSPLEEVQVGAIREQVDMVKVVLSFDEVVFVEIPRVDDDYIQVPLTRGDLTALSFNLFNSTMFRTLDQVLHSAGIQARDVNQVYSTVLEPLP